MTTGRDANLKIAIEHHQAGRLDEAERLYDRLHKSDPRDAEVLYLLGVLCCDMGLFEPACRLLEKAIDISDEFPEARLQLAAAHNGLAQLQVEAGELDAARQHLEHALVWVPGDAQSLRGLGQIELRLERFMAAEAYLRTSLRRAGTHAEALNWLGLAQLQQHKYDEAEASLRAALTADPRMNQSRNNLGLALHHLGRLADAQTCFQAALLQDPFYYRARINLANTLRALGQPVLARRELETVLVDHPQSADALNNLGAVLQDLGIAELALRRLDEAATLNRDKPEIRWNLALTQLQLGNFPDGWRNFETRWEGCAHLRGGYTLPPERAWQGEPLAGKRLLLWAEQGFGDTLQFVRFAADLAQAGTYVMALVPPELVALLGEVPGIDKVMAQGGAIPTYDFHCPLMSLPYRLNLPLDAAALRGTTPYVFAQPALADAWRERLKGFGGLKVGVVWAGNSRLQTVELALVDTRRSVRLEDLAPLFAVAGCSFFSLQKGAPAALSDAAGSIMDFSDEWRDFADTAAFLVNLDLVISVDTAVAHLAGALGVRVWLLNRYDSCWRWLLDREDSPWYATLRQFRQPHAGAWAPAIGAAAEELRRVAARGFFAA